MNHTNYVTQQNRDGNKTSRVRKSGRATQPITLSEIEIPEEMRRTQTGDVFLIKDSQVGDERVINFGSSVSIKHLCRSDIIVMDGTFHS